MSSLNTIYDDKFVKTSLYFSVWIIIMLGSTMILIDWYVMPAITGMNMVSDYLQNQSDNHILDIIGFNQDEIVNEKVTEFKGMMENGEPIEDSLDKIMSDVNTIQEDGLKQMYSVILYQFSPLVTLFAVWYLHLNTWSWVCRKICKILKLSNTLKKTDGVIPS